MKMYNIKIKLISISFLFILGLYCFGNNVEDIQKYIETKGFRYNSISLLTDQTISNVAGFSNNTYSIDAKNSVNSNLTALYNVPVGMLNLHSAKFTSLRGIENMQTLKYIDLSYTKVKDISLIKGLPLDYLSLVHTPVISLAPLKESSVKILLLGETKVFDLSPLSGNNIRYLDISSTKVSCLAPLTNSPIRFVGLSDCPNIKDLSPLTNCPIAGISFGRNSITNLELILLFELEAISFDPKNTKENIINGLRNMKTLRSINSQSANMFWERYDNGDFN